MENFIAWLLGVPAGALVLAYVLICACVLSAKRRRAGPDIHQTRAPLGITVFPARARSQRTPECHGAAQRTIGLLRKPAK